MVYTVPCGKCEACLNKRAFGWVVRLDLESSMNRYTLFVTLTYDEQHLPMLSRLSPVYAKQSAIEYYDSETSEVFNLSSCRSFTAKDFQFVADTPFLPVLSRRDIQLFFKRLRKLIYTTYYDPKEKIRYYIVGEYGGRSARPHYHALLFFNSQRLATDLPRLLRQVWTYGAVFDPHIVSGSAASYCAAYLASFADLPAVYTHPKLRPFALSSKSPSIGSLFVSTEKIQRLFFDGDFKFTIFSRARNEFFSLPLWRSIEDRLYPRIRCFGELSSSERNVLYRLCESIPAKTAEQFKDEIIDRYNYYVATPHKAYSAYSPREVESGDFALYPCFPTWILDYFYYISHYDHVEYEFKYNDNLTTLKRQKVHKTRFNVGSLERFAYQVRCLAHNAALFGISITEYLEMMQTYFQAKHHASLTNYYNQLDDYNKFAPAYHFLLQDVSFCSRVHNHPFDELKVSDKMLISLYNVPIKDGLVQLSLESERFFQAFCNEQKDLAKKLTKTKSVNDYILAHADKFQNLINYYG